MRRLAGLAALLVVLAVPAVVHGTYLIVGVYAGIYAIAAVGNSLLIGSAGVVGIGQAGFLAVGAYTTAILTVRHGWNEALAALAAICVAGVAGAVVGLPALRLTGHYLSLATLAFGVVVGIVANEWSFTGGNSGIFGVPKPQVGLHSFYEPADYFRLVWPIAFGCALLVAVSLRGRAGRALRAGKDSEIAALTLGVATARQRLQCLAMAGALAGLAGALYAYWVGIVTPQASSVEISAQLLIMAVVCGSGVWAALCGAVFVEVLQQVLTDVVPTIIPSASGDYQLLGLGLVLVVVVIAAPRGLLAPLGRVARRAPAAVVGEPFDNAPDADVPALRAEHLFCRFGGITAVADVSLTVAPGTIVGLIGPNGAGKTTVFNLVSGVTRGGGRVRVAGNVVRSGRARQVARFGASRTFQNVLLFASMTVRENVLVGCHQHGRAGLVAAATGFADRHEERALARRAQWLLDMFGLADVADSPAVELPFGRQRLVEVARAVASASSLLLLDEPMAGLSGPERAALAEALRRLVANGRAVLLVEHDLDAVMSLCDEVAVMDQGRLITCASPAEVRADPRVVAAYIGPDPVVVP